MPTIIFIGPMGAGKSTVADLLAKKLQMPRCELDAVRWDYYNEIGYDHNEAHRLRREDGPWAMLQYWKPFEVHAVERVLAEYPDHVIDFGAGHSVYDDAAQLRRVAAALAPFPHVILLLPAPDVAESMRILNERARAVMRADDVPDAAIDEWLHYTRYFVEHPSNQRLAKRTVYTKEKSPEATCTEIMEYLVL